MEIPDDVRVKGLKAAQDFEAGYWHMARQVACLNDS